MKDLCKLDISPRLYKMGKNTREIMKKRMINITKDLHRVATDLTPYKDGGLEQSGTYKNVTNKHSFTGTVTFGAKGDTYLYAEKIHDGDYELGEKSLAKNNSGVKTIYSDKTFKVGKGYLKETAKECEKGYREYLEKDILKDLDRR